MRGWMIVFATAAVSAAGMTLTGSPVSPSAKVTSCVFAILFLLGLVARGLRGRAW